MNMDELNQGRLEVCVKMFNTWKVENLEGDCNIKVSCKGGTSEK